MRYIDLTKKVSLLWKLWQYLRLNRGSIYFAKNLLVDSNEQRSRRLYDEVKRLQINPNVPIFRDRLREVREFYDISIVGLIGYFLVYGAPNSRYFKYKLYNQFEGKTNAEHLKSAYENTAFLYSLRLMLGYERYSDVESFIEHIGLWSKNTQSEILDYGCGVADIGLMLSHLGCNVTMADLDDKKLDFAKWRFVKRGFKPKVIRIANTEEFPELGDQLYDLIIASELLEHVRNPLKLLRNFTKALKINGYLYDTLGMRYKFHQARGSHLEEAKHVVESKEYYEYYRSHYMNLYERDERLKNLYQRVA